MSNFGRSLHVRATPVARLGKHAKTLGARLAVLGKNRDWTSFAVLGTKFEPRLLCALACQPVLDLWRDDDSGMTLSFHLTRDEIAQIALPPSGAWTPGPRDLELLALLESRAVLPPRAIEPFRRCLGAGTSGDEPWDRVVLAALGVPFVETLPPAVDAATLACHAPEAKVVGRSVPTPPPRWQSAPLPDVAARAWTERERHVLDLAFEYLSTIWSLNDFVFYERLRRHLPPTLRREANHLVDDIMNHELARARDRHDRIMTVVWEADDWLEILRSPKLEGDAEWRSRLRAAASRD